MPVEGREGVPTLGREGALGRVLGVDGRDGVLGRVLGRVLGVDGRDGALGRVLGLGRLIDGDGRDDGERLNEEPPDGRLIDGLRLMDREAPPPPRPPPPPPRPPRAKLSLVANMRMTAMAIRESRVFFMVSPLFLSCLLRG
jgi:hypothetical protein